MRRTTQKYILIIAIIIVILAIIVIALKSNNETPIVSNVEAKIGVILPLTGNSSFAGEDMQNGMILADEELENLTLLYENSNSTIQDAVTAFNKLNIDDTLGAFVHADVGATALVPLAEKNKKPLFLTVSSTSGLPAQGKYIFRYFTNADTDAPVIAKYGVNDLGLKKFVVLYINDQFGIDYKNVFGKTVEKYGGQVMASESYQYTDFDFRTQITKLKQYDFDGIYIVGLAHQLVPMINQIKELGIDKQILAMGTIAVRNYIDQLGSSGENIYLTAFCTDGLPQDFVDKFMERFNEYPGFYAQQGYDMVRILSEVINSEGPEPEEIRSGLSNVKNFIGNSGEVKVDPTGEILIPMCVKRIENGKILNLATGNYSDF